MGCRIEFACDGLKAVSRMSAQNDANEPFDLVLMDIFMPNMDGGYRPSSSSSFARDTPFFCVLILLSLVCVCVCVCWLHQACPQLV
jgi:PleD family two-component response regulator